jgi:lipopolysaccharide heptosyltransferase II
VGLSELLDPKKILIILHGSIGDVTRALPLVGMIRKGFPQAYLAWAVEPPSLPLLTGYPGLDEVILFDRRRPLRDFGPFLRRVRSGRFDLVLDLQRHFKSGLISRLSGARHRIGFNRRDAKEFNWLFNNRFIPAFGDTIPKLDHYAKFAEYLGLKALPIEWRFELSTDERSRIDRHLAKVTAPYAVFFVGSRWESKQWFPNQIAECADALYERRRLEIVLLGSKEDQSIAAQALGQARVPLVDLVGRTSLREALAIIDRARVAIGPDTGLMHIAAAVGTPVVSLWGATSSLRAGPHGFSDLTVQGKAPCAPCYLRRCPIGRICMQSIRLEEVMEKLDRALSHATVKAEA